MKVEIADSSEHGGAISGRRDIRWLVGHRGNHHFAQEAFADIPRSGAQSPAMIDALRIDAFNPDRALVALPGKPISGVRTGLQWRRYSDSTR